MTQKERMLAGKLYDPLDPELAALRTRAHKLSKAYNDTTEDQVDLRREIMEQLVPALGEGSYIQGPVQFDYGVFTTFGKRCYANFNLTVLDVCPVTIGDDVFIGPNCTLVPPLHPLLAAERRIQPMEDGHISDVEYGAPIVIGDGCWLASNVTVCGGVTIGAGCVIGAGSVVTRDIPAGSLAAGVPCRVIRPITEADSVYLKQELL